MIKTVILSLISMVFAASTDHSQDHFFDAFAKAAQHSQKRILIERDHIEQIPLNTNSSRNLKWIEATAKKYKVNVCSQFDDACKTALLEKVNIVPTSMTLAQAAIESGYGQSRFAKEGNAYFGQWCFESQCGLQPINPNQKRAFFAVKSYPSMSASIDDYMLNLNRHPAYAEFRSKRKLFLSHQIGLLQLPPTLIAYSKQRQQYVKKLNYMLIHYDLKRYD